MASSGATRRFDEQDPTGPKHGRVNYFNRSTIGCLHRTNIGPFTKTGRAHAGDHFVEPFSQIEPTDGFAQIVNMSES